MADARTFNILGVDFTVSQPFDAGHTCTEGEARALNQLRKENLGNNFRSVVKTAQDDAEKAGGTVDTADLQAKFADLDSKYEFTVANVGASAKLDPVEREARSLVRTALRDHFAAQGKKFSDLSDDDQEKLIAANAAREDIVSVATNIVNQRKATLGLSLEVADTPTEAAPTEAAPAE